ncbi:alpha/beta fold hydrolase [Actinopolymorpha pittospori]
MQIDGFTDHFAAANGIRLHFVVGGQGDPLVLLPGWPRTWWQFHKMMPALSQRHRVIAVDLRGMGESDKPDSGYDKKTMAADIHGLVRSLDIGSVNLAGEDIGAMVAYSLAANHPEVVRKVALWEGFHPTELFNEMRLMPREGVTNMWWFPFNHVDQLPEDLLAGRFRILLDWLIEYESDPSAFSEETRSLYAAAYDSPAAIRAGNGWYKTIQQDIEDAAEYPELDIPFLVLGGMYYDFMTAALKGRVKDPRFVEFRGAGHYLAEERPDDLVRELTSFFE